MEFQLKVMNKTANKVIGWTLMSPLIIVALIGSVDAVVTLFKNASKDDLYVLFGTLFVLLCTAVSLKFLLKD
jgi:hypothetical protein